eukprot:9036692-Pyramimonas_sp.AAC.1
MQLEHKCAGSGCLMQRHQPLRFRVDPRRSLGGFTVVRSGQFNAATSFRYGDRVIVRFHLSEGALGKQVALDAGERLVGIAWSFRVMFKVSS